MLSPSLAILLSKRQRFFVDCDAFRLSHFELDARLTVDYYAGYLLCTYYKDYAHQRLPELAAQFAQELKKVNLPVRGAVKKFRPEASSQQLHNIFPGLFADVPIRIYAFKQMGRSNVTGHNDNRILKVHLTSETVS